jgi:hypothetical protein
MRNINGGIAETRGKEVPKNPGTNYMVYMEMKFLNASK